MHLKSLTLRGFKSFASATTLVFEPGITAVVGPNGSGKSNVVDAIAWVLGEQGAKALRGGKMDDVIFAGTADRAPLGRAEVTLTIDNADGALPIEYSEVSITRRMFRDGAGEYEINGRSCRLLDIQELLSDSGIGREMHVIVGQGQLDAVLSARPEDRRAFIEEAAGVLKHRKRRERADRKLGAMQANLDRLTDLTAELRRQLKPLGRQAEVARRAAGVQADLRDSKARLLADEIATLSEQLEQEARAEQQALELRADLQARVTDAQAQDRAAASALQAAVPAQQRAQETWFELSALLERFRGTSSLARERARSLATLAEAPAAPGRDPAELEAAADRAEAEQEIREAALEATRSALADAVAARTDAEATLARAESAFLAAGRAVADRREGLARLAGQVNAARSRLAAGADELTRLAAARTDAEARATAAQQEFDRLQESVGDLDSSELDLDEAHETAVAAVEAGRQRVQQVTEQQRETRTRQTGLRARVDALSLGLDRKDGAGALLAASDDLPGLLGSLSTLLDVVPGAERAIAAALGATADAVASASLPDAHQALTWLQEQDAGRAALVIGQAADGAASDPGGHGPAPEGTRWAVELVTAPAALRPAVRALLAEVVVADDLERAVAVAAGTGLRAVTRGGDLVGPHWASGGAAGKQSTLEIQAALDEAETALAAATAEFADLQAAEQGAREELTERERIASETLAALHASDAQLSAVGEQLGRLGAAARSAAAEAQRFEHQQQALAEQQEAREFEFAELQERMFVVEADEVPEDVDATERDEAAAVLAVARQREMDARLAVRTDEERVRASSGTAENLRRSARAELAARARAEAVARRRGAAARVAQQVAASAEQVTERLLRSAAEADEARQVTAERREQAQQHVERIRAELTRLQGELDRLTDTVHRDEVLRAQQALRAEQLAERALAEFAMSAEDLIGSFGPQVPVPPTAAELAEYHAARDRGESVSEPPAMPYDRATQERRARRAERDLATLGKVNPLALEEFAALEERHAFLSTQLEDLKATRKDLLGVIKEVDEKILEVFTAAYHDVAREFGTVFSTLFPGGDGELVLTDPSDMLTTGIEVHARPPGKKVKRLSLLSGGERSLTAVAMLVAIFRARPSPFYIMDEVEAALDEVNLTRLVGLLTQLRESSQLIIITHQKFTMEVADALYGVSMRGDGITTVISQRIRSGDAATTPV
ncbi:chromosome segregation protein SMC [Nakamurella leprariae]|uniref:Chromosome partition protein Smc n=1 Tax=Nakamurella leprariae TaxID=2803911 RepID=A0A938YF39_9ACTN|nr:chromosome segregation protein SMC [Nakamurella leprariae]MBM9469547.1 chromosome segregation protein SMC [Nakamurella leprariae]